MVLLNWREFTVNDALYPPWFLFLVCMSPIFAPQLNTSLLHTARPLDESIPTFVIKKYELLLHQQINGVESLEIVDGVIYATDQNCDVLKIENDKITQRFSLIKDKKCDECCTALGIRHWKGSQFVLADGVLGILVVDFKDESIKQLLSSINLIGKHAVMFADDFDFVDNETIVFSDLAAGCPLHDLFMCLYGGVKSSRLIQLNLRTLETRVLMDDEFGLNGVQMHTDRQSVLVAQSMLSRILRYYIDGPKRGQVEVFIDALPGLPDNIRPSSKGNTFWIACFSSRSPNNRIFAQSLGPYPALRGWLFSITQTVYPLHLFDLIMTAGSSSQHIFLELDESGRIISAVNDVDGKFPFTTQITDGGSHLYFSSIGTDYVGRAQKIF